MAEPEATNPDNEPILAIMGRFYPFDPDNGIPFADTTLVIKETQNYSHDVDDGDGGTGLNVWDGALLLARYLEKKPDTVCSNPLRVCALDNQPVNTVKNKRILELGAGCGLVGIAAGVLGAKQVVMTDLAYTLPLMKENVSSNESAWKNSDNQQETIHCKECDWFQPPPINALFAQMNDSPEDSVCPDVILVADCVWLSHLVAPLLQTLQAYAKKSSTKVIITYQQRGREAHEEFWKGIHDLFEDVVDVDTESSVGLAKPDVFHVMECHVMKNSDLIN